MMIFAGIGGNGESQTNGVPPYDNIWPHSSDLRGAYTDPATGLTGYISDDQLRDLEGRPLWYTDAVAHGDDDRRDTGDALKVFVRVGPYNVNPETAIDQGERDLARVRPLARPARLLLDRHRDDLRRRGR